MQIQNVADFLIHEAAKEGRSLTYNQILKHFGHSQEYHSVERKFLTAKILPEMGSICHKNDVAILACLAVSDITRKPEDWFRILVTDQLNMALPREFSEKHWQDFVLREQNKAVKFWGARDSWPFGATA